MRGIILPKASGTFELLPPQTLQYKVLYIKLIASSRFSRREFRVLSFGFRIGTPGLAMSPDTIAGACVFANLTCLG